MSDWRRIDETTPIGSPVDLWVRGWDRVYPQHGRKRHEYRVTDCTHSAYVSAWLQGSSYVTGRWFRDEEGQQCWAADNDHEDSVIATHWMPRPGPPRHLPAKIKFAIQPEVIAEPEDAA